MPRPRLLPLAGWSTLLGLLIGFVGLAAPVPSARAATAPTPVVLVGAPGLSWSDVDPDLTPTLAGLAERGATANLTVRSVRTVACPADGWLTLSAGRRAAEPAPTADDPGCRPLPQTPDELALAWPDYLQAATADRYGARIGLLGSTARADRACVTGVGPGGLIAAADHTGVEADAGPTGTASTAGCLITVVDGGELPQGLERRPALQDLDDLVHSLLDDGQGRADVIVAGLADGDNPVRLRAVLAAGPSFPAGTLTSTSTRQPGLVQTQDLTATLLARLGADPPVTAGRPLSVVPGTRDLVGAQQRASTLRALAPQVTGVLALLLAGAGLAAWVTRRRSAPPWVRDALAVIAALPIATFLANLLPWWKAPLPGTLFVLTTLGIIALLVLAQRRASTRHPWGDLLVLAAVTAATLGLDVLFGSRLQLGSVFGQQPVVGGRFYGFGNTTFALYAAAVLVLVHALAVHRDGSAVPLRRWWLAVAVLAVALVLEAAPTWGADFGGPPALLVGGGLLLIQARGIRLRTRVVLPLLAGGALLIVAVAWWDWRRGAGTRTHLGEFVQTVLDGGAGDVLSRKISQNLANLGSPALLGMALGVVLLALVWWASRPGRWARRLAVAGLLVGVVGMALNDSGLVVPVFVGAALAPLFTVPRRGTQNPPDPVSDPVNKVTDA